MNIQRDIFNFLTCSCAINCALDRQCTGDGFHLIKSLLALDILLIIGQAYHE